VSGDLTTAAFNWSVVQQMNGPNGAFDRENAAMSEEAFRSVEAAFMLDRADSKELLNKPSVGGLAWVMYRLLTGDPKWDAATTIEALRGAIRKLYRDHVIP
jgi:hypothetical protein